MSFSRRPTRSRSKDFAKTRTDRYPAGIPKEEISFFLSRAVDIAERAKVRDATELALSLGPYGATMTPQPGIQRKV